MFCPLAHISSTRPRQPRKLFSILIMLGAPAPPRGGPFIPKKSSAQWSCTPQSMIHPESQHAVQDAHTRAQSHARTDGQRRRQTAATPSPRSFIFSVENAACKDSYRCKCRRNRILRSLPTLASVRILTDSVLYRENERTWAPGCSCTRSGCHGVFGRYTELPLLLAAMQSSLAVGRTVILLTTPFNPH